MEEPPREYIKRKNMISFRFVLMALIPAILIILFIGRLYLFPAISIEAEMTEEVEASMIEENIQKEGVNGKPLEKVVYLTFDDGPSRLTERFLDVLHEEDVKATFFMQGRNLKKTYLQESVRRAIKEGHYVGGHSMTHTFEVLYDEEQFVPEMSETLALIEDITGTKPNLVRPPYGSAPGLANEKMRDQIVDVGIKIWDWTIDSKDWALKDDPQKIIEIIKNETKFDVEVVLLHETPQTLEVLPVIIEFYREQGYAFVVYDEAEHFYLNFQKDERL